MTRLLDEDLPFLVGAARYTADLDLDDASVGTVAFVRATVAHGRITGVDASAATARRGVHAVLTAADLGVAPFSFFPKYAPFARPVLAEERVRFAGEPVALIIASDPAAAEDAAEDVVVDVEPWPALVDPEAATLPDAPVLHPLAGTNEVDTVVLEPEADPLSGAAVVIRRRYPSPRLSPLPLETSAILARPQRDGSLEVWASCQGVHAVRQDIATALGLDREAVRVRAAAVGGGFGARYRPPVEYLAVAAAARLSGRPLRWVEARTEQLLGQPHGRAQRNDLELGVRPDGTLTGVRVRCLADAGAYPHQAPILVDYTMKMAAGPYRVPAVDFAGLTVVTTTAPVGAYRGAGQPEIAIALERALDEAAHRLDLDPLEIRRRNLLTPGELPHRTSTGVTYDSGDFPAALAQAADAIDYGGVRIEQQARRRRGERIALGVGVASYAQIAGAGQLSFRGQVAVAPDGTVSAGSGGHSHGQGHRSTFAPLLAAKLGVHAADVRWLDADTAAVSRGLGTGGSRTTALAGTAVSAAADRLLERARAVAAELLEADPADVVVMDGGLGVAGVPASTLPWAEIASGAGPDGLAEVVDTPPLPANHPYGCHACVVEVDLDTGGVRVRAHAAVDDCGVRLAPALVEGQQHGGAVAGLSQALGEAVLYDLDGTPRTPTLVEYWVPAASEVPSIIAAGAEVAATTNPLGVRGIGENGAIAATPALANAVADALGVAHVDLPLTPERVWRWTQGEAL